MLLPAVGREVYVSGLPLIRSGLFYIVNKISSMESLGCRWLVAPCEIHFPRAAHLVPNPQSVCTVRIARSAALERKPLLIPQRGFVDAMSCLSPDRGSLSRIHNQSHVPVYDALGRKGSRAVCKDIGPEGMIKGIENGFCHGGRVSDGSEDAISAMA